MANKVTNIINCSGRQIPNHWEPIGVKYLTYYWLDQENQIILDNKGRIENECYSFINSALDKTDSILIHSVKGQSRACTIALLWIIRKYQWTLQKSLEYLRSRKPDLEIRLSFIRQLSSYENRLKTQGIGPKTSDWEELYDKTNNFENEELLLRNTYLNAKMGPFADLMAVAERLRPPKLKWTDESKEKTPLATIIQETKKSFGIYLTPIVKDQSRNNDEIAQSKSACAISGTYTKMEESNSQGPMNIYGNPLKKEDSKTKDTKSATPLKGTAQYNISNLQKIKLFKTPKEDIEHQALIKHNQLEMEKFIKQIPELNNNRCYKQGKNPALFSLLNSDMSNFCRIEQKAIRPTKYLHNPIGIQTVSKTTQSARPSSAIVKRENGKLTQK